MWPTRWPSHLPNLISLARLFLAPLTVWLIILGEYPGAFWVFIAAGVSDALDGLLARWLQARTLLGSYLDPIADKALLMGAFLALGYKGILPLWIVILVVSRDLFILGGAVLIQTLKPEIGPIEPSRISKMNTVAQILLAGAALGLPALALGGDGLLTALGWLAAATTVLSGVGYLLAAGRRLGLERIS